MATILIDGFDKYGTSNVAIPTADSSLAMGRWTSVTAYGQPIIIPGLTGMGYAVQMPGVSSILHYAGLSITLPSNFSRLIGGFRFTSNLGGFIGCAFLDNYTYQSTITIQPTSGFVSVQTGQNVTNLAIAPASVAGNTVHYLEFDVTFNSGELGGYTIWLDGVQVLEGTGTMITSGHNYANVFQFYVQGFADEGATGEFDDLYLFDDTTSFNNSALLSNPAIVTQFPIGDHQAQFANNGNVFGNSYVGNSYEFGVSDVAANTLFLMPFTPNVDCTINSIGIYTAITGGASATANFKGVIYADSGGIPHSLLSSGTQVTGCTAGEQLILPLTTPQALTAGTQYWLGLILDTAVYMQWFDGYATAITFNGYKANNTYSSGAPATAPSMAGDQPSLCVFGACSGAATNWESEALNPPIGDLSSVASNVTGTEDLYVFPAVPVTVVAIYTVCVSGNARLTYPGTHTIDLIADSGGTSSPGTNTDIPPTLSYAWYDSLFDTDPNTSAAWTPTAVSNGFYGMKIAT